MGYFSSGTEGLDYEERYCSRCVHSDWGKGEDEAHWCPVMLLHQLHNYEEANKDDSFLHTLIPLNANGDNEQCAMFYERPATPHEPLADAEALAQWRAAVAGWKQA